MVLSITNNSSSPYADALKHGSGIREQTRPVQSDKGTVSKPMGTTTNKQWKQAHIESKVAHPHKDTDTQESDSESFQLPKLQRK